MGIYSSSSIFGIRIYNFNDDDISNILFEKTYNKIMTDKDKRAAYLFYTELNNKNEIRFQYYTECSNTYSTARTPELGTIVDVRGLSVYDLSSKDKGTFLMWCPISLDLFLEVFNVLN